LEKSNYAVSAKFFRTHCKFYLISKKIHSKDAFIVSGIEDKNREIPLKNYIDVYYHEFKKIAISFYGLIF